MSQGCRYKLSGDAASGSSLPLFGDSFQSGIKLTGLNLKHPWWKWHCEIVASYSNYRHCDELWKPLAPGNSQDHFDIDKRIIGFYLRVSKKCVSKHNLGVQYGVMCDAIRFDNANMEFHKLWNGKIFVMIP